MQWRTAATPRDRRCAVPLMPGTTERSMKPHTAALLVLNYNGRQHLQDCLSTALTAAAEIEGPCPVVLVDNRSTDASVAFTRKHFPAVEVVVSPRNDGMGRIGRTGRCTRFRARMMGSKGGSR